MSVVTIISVFIGVLVLAGILFVISEVRADNQRKVDVQARNRRMTRSVTHETEVA